MASVRAMGVVHPPGRNTSADDTVLGGAGGNFLSTGGGTNPGSPVPSPAANTVPAHKVKARMDIFICSTSICTMYARSQRLHPSELWPQGLFVVQRLDQGPQQFGSRVSDAELDGSPNDLSDPCFGQLLLTQEGLIRWIQNVEPHAHEFDSPPMIWMSGMNRAMTIVPTTTARKTMRTGSMIEVMAATALSTSSS